MFRYLIINNADLTQDLKHEICLVKRSFGQYTNESQIKWMEEHLRNEDLHFLLYHNESVVAYCNLVERVLICDNQSIDVLGVGNVCSVRSGQGFGAALMFHVNKYMQNSGRVGMLFCKENLVSFYGKFDWNLISILEVNCKTMIYNFPIEVNKFRFTDRLF